jgi:hypothetical protein
MLVCLICIWKKLPYTFFSKEENRPFIQRLKRLILAGFTLAVLAYVGMFNTLPPGSFTDASWYVILAQTVPLFMFMGCLMGLAEDSEDSSHNN